jgi:hypothetical protein
MADLGLIRRRQLPVPTIRGGLLLCVVVLAIISLAVQVIYPFLAVNEPVDSTILVVEGWLPDYALEKVREEFERGGYRLIITTGEELMVGSYLSSFRSYAELAAGTLQRLGISQDSVVAVPASRVKRDRTFASAVALQRWLQGNGSAEESINLATLGAHARRSRSIFQKVLGGSVSVGVLAVPDEGFDSEAWWKTSRGVNVIVDETIGYVYWVLFG